MLHLIPLIAFTLVVPQSKNVEYCKASVFAYEGDQWAGGKSRYLKRHVRPTDIGIAHRWWPLGAKVRLWLPRTGRWADGVVLDRGPYGAIVRRADIPKGKRCIYTRGTYCWYVKTLRSEPGRWRGCADLTPAIKKQLGHNGFERVVIWLLERPGKKKKAR